MSSSEERLARLEVLVAEQRDDIKEMRVQMADLVKAAHWGPGAGWVLIKTGVALVGLAGVAKLVWDVVKHP